jgi:hypothetical protein
LHFIPPWINVDIKILIILVFFIHISSKEKKKTPSIIQPWLNNSTREEENKER